MSKISQQIESHSKFGIKLGLDNIKAVLARLENPQAKVETIHIAGTNGKGSVSSIISSCLLADGYKVAKYCSPYLIDFTEMFIINDNPISETELATYYQQVCDASRKEAIELTLYEVTTAIMFLYAAANKVDYLVLEVGLGGRLDATNVVVPKVSVITNISLDHTHILGDTISQIAAEKAGIIKAEVPLFTAEQDERALAVFRAKTEDIHQASLNFQTCLNYDTFQTEIRDDERLYKLNLFGIHQTQNFGLALSVLEYLKVSGAAIESGCKSVSHPGRLERIADNIIFDGAHNPASAAALVSTLSSYQRPINIIFSCLRDKDVEAVVKSLKQLSRAITFIPLPNLERGMSASEFNSLGIDGIKIADTIESGLVTGELNLICGTFSLYPQTKTLATNYPR